MKGVTEPQLCTQTKKWYNALDLVVDGLENPKGEARHVNLEQHTF